MVLRLQGGLGNQLFQLLALRYLCAQSDVPGAIFTGDLHRFPTRRELSMHELLEGENILPNLSRWDSMMFSSKLSKVASKVGLHSIDSVKKLRSWRGQHLNGYFQDVYNYHNFDLVKQEIEKVDRKVTQLYEEPLWGNDPKCCAVHLRLTDFVQNKAQRDFLYNYRIPYIRKAIARLKAEYDVEKFVIFTDAPREAKELLQQPEAMLLGELGIGNLTLIKEFSLLTGFPFLITSNSTFSFWSSLLGRKKTIVFPTVWDALNSVDDKNFQNNISVHNRIAASSGTIIRVGG